MNRADVYAAIDAERDRQETLWRGDHSWGNGSCASLGVAPIVKAAVLTEEAGEVARSVLDEDGEALRQELVQVAAVAVAGLESMA